LLQGVGAREESEYYRLIRNVVANTRGRVLAITPLTAPADGVAAGLARALCEGGERVLLIDGKLRRHDSASGADAGATQQTNRRPDLAQLLVEGCLPPIFARDGSSPAFLAAGVFPHDPAQLMTTARMRKLLERLLEQFERIVLDLPPVLQTTAALAAAAAADVAIAIVCARQSDARACRGALRLLSAGGVEVLGVVVMNAADGAGTGGAGASDAIDRPAELDFRARARGRTQLTRRAPLAA